MATVPADCADCDQPDGRAPPAPSKASGPGDQVAQDLRPAVLSGPPQTDSPLATVSASTPRVVITYCTQCRWMLRAAYFAQELLSTFGTAIGEVALRPATGGIFQVDLTYYPKATNPAGHDTAASSAKQTLLWDRKAEGGFPETKVLKQRVRDCIEPDRDLGHSDRHGKKT